MHRSKPVTSLCPQLCKALECRVHQAFISSFQRWWRRRICLQRQLIFQNIFLDPRKAFCVDLSNLSIPSQILKTVMLSRIGAGRNEIGICCHKNFEKQNVSWPESRQDKILNWNNLKQSSPRITNSIWATSTQFHFHLFIACTKSYYEFLETVCDGRVPGVGGKIL